MQDVHSEHSRKPRTSKFTMQENLLENYRIKQHRRSNIKTNRQIVVRK